MVEGKSTLALEELEKTGGLKMPSISCKRMRGCIAEIKIAVGYVTTGIKKEDYLVTTGVANVLLRSDFGLHAIRSGKEKGSLALFGQGNFS